MSILRRRGSGRARGRALVPTSGGTALPQVHLPETGGPIAGVYCAEPGDIGTAGRLKWLASTCLAGVVGVGVIGVTLYASMKVDDGNGVMSSIRRAGLAALAPVQLNRAIASRQTVAGHKADRIQTTALGLSTRHIIHDSVVQRRAGREYIRIKPYARIVASLATAKPESTDRIPPFNPFKLYVNHSPIADANGSGRGKVTPERKVLLKVVELHGGILPGEDGIELRAHEVAELVSQATSNAFERPFDIRTTIEPEGLGRLVHDASYRTEESTAAETVEIDVPRNTTVIAKDDSEGASDVVEGSEIKAVTVRRGDTLMRVLTGAGAETWQAKAIANAMAPVFGRKALRAGQEVRFTLTPAPSDSGQMEPVKVSVFQGGTHKVTVALNAAGEYVASDQPIKLSDVAALRPSQYPQRATLYTSLYHAGLSQRIPSDLISRLLRIHAAHADYKQRVRAGDSFEAFFDLRESEGDGDLTPGELLYTALRFDGKMHRFYRFRTPDGTVDYYDAQGNSARKFLMRKPVKGARFTSGFGMRRHPILKRRIMHTGADWAAPRGTPILAAGNGIIEEAGRKRYYGNYVRIRHSNGFKTSYAHMHRIAKGVRKGVKVRQGQIIGYVGSTGRSTGNHLHFEVLVNNRHVNPMTIRVPTGRQLTGRLLATFHKERTRIDALMRRSPVTTQVAALEINAR